MKVKRKRLVAALSIAVLGIAVTGTIAGAQSASPHSDNMTLIGNWNQPDGDYQGSDLAFWGNRAVAGMLSGPGGFALLDVSNPARPTPQAIFNCPGSQSDVSIWEDLVVMSVDSARGGTNAKGEQVPPESCGAGAASQNELEAGTAWEGLRIVSIANPAKPVQIHTVKTDCGSHTHTLVPEPAKNRLLVYVLSYPLGAPTPTCNAASHRKVTIVEIPLGAPQTAKVVGAVDVSPNIGCHDVTVFLPRKIAGAGCISESQMWDISDPAKPEVIAHIPNPRNNIHHSSTFSWDGNILVLGDELGGAAAAPGCVGKENGGFGGVWFYDVTDPASPELKGNYRLPQEHQSELCTAHLFNVVPLSSERNILVASWYKAGTTVVDFTDPSRPTQLAHYTAKDPVGDHVTNPASNTWASYWYNGAIYANNGAARGLDVFRIQDPAFAAEIPLARLNPQVQEPLPAPRTTAGAAEAITLPGAGSAPRAGAPQRSGRARCTKRKGFKLRLRAPRGQRLRSAVVFVNGRRAKVVRGKALRRAVRVAKLPKGRARIDVTLRTRSGKRISRSRTYRFC